jgi:hypothetical protein
MTQLVPDVSIAADRHLLTYTFLYLYMSDLWVASYMEYSAQIIARSFVPKEARKRKRESDNRKRKAMYLEKKIRIMKQYKSGKPRLGNSFHLHLSESTFEL